MNHLKTLPVVAGILFLTACGSSSTPAAATTATPTETTSTASETPVEPAPSPSLAATTPVAPLPAAEARTQAADILQDADDSLRADFQKGIGIAGDAAPQTSWWTGNGGPTFPQRVISDSGDAFTKADGLFTPDDEPSSITQWRDAWLPVSTDLMNWYQKDQDSPSQEKVVRDFNTLDSLVKSVRDGR